MTYWVYILKCSDETLYTGITTDRKRRIAEHNAGRGSKYTRSRYPVSLVWSQQVDGRSLASSMEYQIKQLSRSDKLQVIREGKTL